MGASVAGLTPPVSVLLTRVWGWLVGVCEKVAGCEGKGIRLALKLRSTVARTEVCVRRLRCVKAKESGWPSS